MYMLPVFYYNRGWRTTLSLLEKLHESEPRRSLFRASSVDFLGAISLDLA